LAFALRGFRSRRALPDGSAKIPALSEWIQLTGESPLRIANPHLICTRETDTSSWNPKVVRFLDYWHSLKPEEGLPGRQHFDPLDIPDLMSRVWMLDVLRQPLRYRYRLAGTKVVEALQREVTGRMFEEVHSHMYDTEETIGRLLESVQHGVPTYRKGNVIAIDKKEHMTIENCVVPMARDGLLVDLIIGISVLYLHDGREV
jgi:hypothetical protein